MIAKEINLCPHCRRELSPALTLEEIPGSATVRARCDNCGKMSFGSRFVVNIRGGTGQMPLLNYMTWRKLRCENL